MSLTSRRVGPKPMPRLGIDPFMLPTATTGRSLLLIITVVGTSLFTYDFMYLAFDAVSADHEDTVWMIAGVLALLLVTGAAYLSMPTWIIRRGRLNPLTPEDSPDLHEEIAQLASEAGLHRPPMLMVDAVNPSVSALVFGLPRRRRLRLNGGLVTLFFTDSAGFRATVRHELAHLRNRDLDQTYLVIAGWRAFLITALVPLVLTMLLQPGLDLLGVTWRAIALTLIVRLFHNAVLRSREYSADARAFQWDGPDGALRRVLGGSATPAAKGRRWSFGTHPLIGSRQAAIESPRPLFGIGFGDAVGVGLACTIASSSVLILLRSIVDQPDPMTVRWVAALFFAPLAAAGLTVGIWRGVWYERSAGPRTLSVLAPGVGLGCGLMLGEPLSLPASITGMWGPGPAPAPPLAAIGLIALLAATVLLTAWIRTCALAWAPVIANRSPLVIVTSVVASALVLTSLLSSWMLLRDLHPLIPTMSRQAARDYAALTGTPFSGPFWLWIAFEHPLILRLVRQDSALLVAVLLWLFPLVGLLRAGRTSASCRRGGGEAAGPKPSTRAMSVALCGLAGGAVYVLITQSFIGTFGLLTVEFAPLFRHWQISCAVVAQGTIAFCVALCIKSFRVAWGLLAAFVTGAMAVLSCSWNSGGELVDLAQRILVTGSASALAAGSLGVALASFARLIRHFTSNSSKKVSAARKES